MRKTMIPAIALMTWLAASARAQDVSKATRILMERGLQILGLVTSDDVFHLETYKAAGYTSINWLWTSDVSKHGAAQGFPWARWVPDEAHMPPVGAEAPYMSQLLAMSLGDEKNLNDPAVRDPYVAWFKSAVPRYPDAIVYANNYGGQVSDAALTDFVRRARPDMIMFDHYPYKSNYETRVPEQPAGGSPTSWYSELRRYRAHALAAGIPFGTYRQSFHAEQDYDRTVYRDPSSSEFRLNTFGALAFGAKYLTDFTYNTGASSFFTKPGGDSHPTPLYDELVRVNHEAANLGKVLVRLIPIAESATSDGQPTKDGRTTSILFVRGRHAGTGGTAVANDLPVGFVPDRQGRDAYSDWEVGRNDPYLRGWEVTNLGEKNGGLAGDVIVSWFRRIDGTAAERAELYVMVTNGLADRTATPAQTRQTVRLNFEDTPATATVELMDPNTGKLIQTMLQPVSGRRQLTLTLDGGSATLFRFGRALSK